MTTLAFTVWTIFVLSVCLTRVVMVKVWLDEYTSWGEVPWYYKRLSLTKKDLKLVTQQNIF